MLRKMFRCSHISLKKRNLLLTFAYLSLPGWPRPRSTTAARITQGHMSQSETLFEVRISHLRTSQIPSHFSATWKTVALVPKLSNDFCKSYPQQINRLAPGSVQRLMRFYNHAFPFTVLHSFWLTWDLSHPCQLPGFLIYL